MEGGDPVGWVEVSVGDVTLGKKSYAENQSKPNPVEIVWEEKFGIEIHYPVGKKPITQCTQPEALWTCTMQFETLNEPAMDEVRDLRVGPHMVTTSLQSICMYLDRKRMVQSQGTNDFVYRCSLSFVEANDGGGT